MKLHRTRYSASLVRVLLQVPTLAIENAGLMLSSGGKKISVAVPAKLLSPIFSKTKRDIQRLDARGRLIRHFSQVRMAHGEGWVANWFRSDGRIRIRRTTWGNGRKRGGNKAVHLTAKRESGRMSTLRPRAAVVQLLRKAPWRTKGREIAPRSTSTEAIRSRI